MLLVTERSNVCFDECQIWLLKLINCEPFKECVKPVPPLPVMTVRRPVIVPLSPLELMYFFQSTSSSSFLKYVAEQPSGYTAVSEPPV